MDLDPGIYLRINEIRTFTLLDFLTCSLTCLSPHYVHLAGRSLLVQGGWTESITGLCWDAAHSYWYHVPRGPWASSTFIPCTPLMSRIIPWVFHPLRIFTFSLDLFLLSKTMSSFPKPCFFWHLFLPESQASVFLQSLCGSRVCGGHPFKWWISLMFVLLMGGLRTCYFCLVQVLSRFMISPCWLQHALRRLLLDNPVQFQTFISLCNTYTQSASC